MFVTALTGQKNPKKLMGKGRRRVAISRIAIIDLGTNSVRLDIYRVNGKKISRTYRGKKMIRLGDGVFRTGRLSPGGIRRGVNAFVEMRSLIEDMKVNRVVAFGTSALRTASNTRQFLDLVKKRTGIQVKVISGQEEGELIAKGILSNFSLPKGRFALIDIGGGSTEISICQGKKVLSCQSYQLGANRLNQMFFKTTPPLFRKGELHPVLAMRQYVREQTFGLRALANHFEVKTVIGSSGTIRTIAKILKKLGCQTQPAMRTDIAALVAELSVMNKTELRKVPGLEPKRTDLILPGAILFEELLFTLGVRRFLVTDLALRDGILKKVIEKSL